MLQQTQVETVIPYYLRWLKRFPTVQAIAEAPEDEILKHWEGMGYYARAQNIQKTARILVSECAGEFPLDHQAILRLPGIGPYTAGAIMSLAFNQDYPAVDGNVERVLARLFDIKTPVKERETRALIWTLAQGLIPKGEARNFNQALMELGAVVCTPKNPLCSACPVDRYCASLRLGIVQDRPVPAKKKRTVAVEAALGILLRGRAYFHSKTWRLGAHARSLGVSRRQNQSGRIPRAGAGSGILRRIGDQDSPVAENRRDQASVHVFQSDAALLFLPAIG